MRPLALLLAVMAAALMIAPARSQDDANPKPKDQNAEAAKKVADPADKIKELQKERIAALREYADMAAELYSKARVEAIDAYKPRLLLLNAEVELAATEADRITLFKGAIDDLNKLEEFFKAWWTKRTGKALSQPVLPFSTSKRSVWEWKSSWSERRRTRPKKRKSLRTKTPRLQRRSPTRQTRSKSYKGSGSPL